MICLQESPPASEIDGPAVGGDAVGVARRTETLGVGIRKRLLAAQKQSGLTVRELAARSHVSPPTIMRARQGGAGGMSAGVLSDIARALGVNAAWLVYGVGPQAGEG